MKTTRILCKKLLATIMAAVFCVHLEDVRAKFRNNILNSTPMIIMANQPTVFAPPAGAALTTCKIHLANTLANSIAVPLTIIGGGVAIFVIRAFLANPAAIITGPPAALGAVIPINVDVALNPAGGGAVALATQSATIAAATLIVACANAVVGGGGAAAVYAGVGGAALNNAALHAVSAVNAGVGAAAPYASVAGGATLGADFINAVRSENIANVFSAAKNLVAAFTGVAGAPVVAAVGAGGAGAFAPGAIPNQVLHLWEHIAERGHLWNPPAPAVPLTAIQQDLHYIVWNRAARVGTPDVPPIHTSFVVPGGTLPNVHFQNLLQGAELASAIPARLYVSWHDIAGMAATTHHIGGGVVNNPSMPNDPLRGVNLHFNVGAVGGGLPGAPALGNVIKCNLRYHTAAGGALRRDVVSKFVGAGGLNATGVEAEETLCEAISSLSELRAQMSFGAALPAGIFLPLLDIAGVGAPAAATASVPVPPEIITICVNTRNIATMFAE